MQCYGLIAPDKLAYARQIGPLGMVNAYNDSLDLDCLDSIWTPHTANFTPPHPISNGVLISKNMVLGVSQGDMIGFDSPAGAFSS